MGKYIDSYLWRLRHFKKLEFNWNTAFRFPIQSRYSLHQTPTEVYCTCYFQAVTHQGTAQVRRFLTPVIARESVCRRHIAGNQKTSGGKMPLKLRIYETFNIN